MTKNNIVAKDYNIFDYLNELDAIIIPRYQRNYAWEVKNIKELLYDLIHEDNYYIGNIIVNDLNGNTIEIIDGQQRMISIFLIYLALYHLHMVDDINHIIKNGELKLGIENRIEAGGGNIMKLIYDNTIPTFALKFNEVKRFRDIKKFLQELSEEKCGLLIQHMKNSKIVEIKFINSEYLSHEMFVNLNTKGKPLEAIEIIKSHLFRYLTKGNHSDFYKEEWFHMLDIIGEKYHGKYLQVVGLFKSCSRKKTTEKDAQNYLIDYIKNETQAKEIFKFMTDKMNGLLLVFAAVKKHDLNSLKSYINREAQISFDNLDRIWKMYGQIRFEQFDIVMVGLLYLPTSKNKNDFAKNYIRFTKFLKLLLFFVIYNSIKKISPSTYANRFESIAVDVFLKKKNINDAMKDLLIDLNVDKIEKNNFIDTINGLRCSAEKKSKNGNSRDLKFARLLIQIIDDNYMQDLKSEHIIPESQNMPIVYQCGNILPVIKDRYKNNNIEEKIILYKEDASVNRSIKKFLQLNPDEKNIEEIIEQRTLQIANDCWTMFEELKKECLR